jgi:hypothetical protein
MLRVEMASTAVRPGAVENAIITPLLLGDGREAACRAPRPRREGRIAAGIDDNEIADDLELSSRLLDLLDQLVQINSLHDELSTAANSSCDWDQIVGPAILGGGAVARK